MSNWRPFFYAFSILVVLNIIISLVMTGFNYDISMTNPNTTLGTSTLYNLFVNYLTANFIDLIPTGIIIFGVNVPIPTVNPFALFGNFTTDYIGGLLISLTYLPDLISIPFFILLNLSFFLFIIKLVLP